MKAYGWCFADSKLDQLNDVRHATKLGQRVHIGHQRSDAGIVLAIHRQLRNDSACPSFVPDFCCYAKNEATAKLPCENVSSWQNSLTLHGKESRQAISTQITPQ